MNKVLVVGSGGREHALAWKLAQSPRVSTVIVAPGNDAWPGQWRRWGDVRLTGTDDFRALAERARSEGLNLAVIGPDNPLADGIVDVLRSYGISCFGPTAVAAKIEASKAFAKEVMQSAGVPTARYFVAQSAAEARKILKSVPWGGWVLKADGLALGKGVRVCGTYDEAISAVDPLIGLTTGSNGQLVIEERLQGEELSWMAFCDGERCALLEPARDHKRLLDGDRGPNTGGMGAFSPVPGVPDTFWQRVRDEVFLPTLREMKRRGSPFQGLLYAGLMADLKSDRFWVLEFNARFGDPETQVLMPRMDDDLFTWCDAVARGDLTGLPERVPFKRESAVVVVAAAAGYPDSPEKGQVVEVTEDRDGIFWAGVRRDGQRLVTAGGRVVGALGMGVDLEKARLQAYDRMKKVRFAGMQFRSDIGADIGGRT